MEVGQGWRGQNVGSGALTGMLWSLRPLCEEATWARYWMTFFVFSVLPAPDSPLETYWKEDKDTHGQRERERVSSECESMKNEREKINTLHFHLGILPFPSLSTNNYISLCLQL